MKIIREYIFQAIFGFVGIVMLAIAVFVGMQKITFLQNSQKTTGTLVDYYEDDEGTSFPKYSFDLDGKQYTFKSGVGSSSKGAPVGTQVGILYQKDNPNIAEVDNTLTIFFLPGIMGFLGIIMTAIAVGITIHKLKIGARDAWLLQNGQKIAADCTGVSVNESIDIQGSKPYYITAQWLDPKSNTVYTYKSNNVWFDPTKYVENKKTITVIIDPENPKKGMVDMSFLPKEA